MASSTRNLTSGPATYSQSQKSLLSISVSRNFSFAKVAAILTVTTGHWYTGTILWIPVTFGLLVFAFSSGYFTAALYGPDIDRGKFWRKKIERLALRFWLAMGFIGLIAVLSGKSVVHWHTLIHLLGLSGVLNWVGIPNASALGLGLWFFTLLLIFYLIYPFLADATRSKFNAFLISVLGFALAVCLEENVKVGHELWLTAYAFVVGVAFGAHPLRLKSSFMLAATLLLWGSLLALNMFGIKLLNTLLIGAGGIALAVWLTLTKLPQWNFIDRIASLERYVLEIFLIHMYLFLRPTGNETLNFFLSLGLIIVVAVILGKFAELISGIVFRDRRK